jgi:hypothetical protein
MNYKLIRVWKELTEPFLRRCLKICLEWLRKPWLPSCNIDIFRTGISHTWNRDVNSSTAIFYSVLMNYEGVCHWSAETTERHAAVDTMWTRHYLLLPLCPNKQFGITSSSNWTLHGLCVAYNTALLCRKAIVICDVLCRVNSRAIFKSCVCDCTKRRNHVVNMPHFESEITHSVSVIVAYLGVFASLWSAY